MVIVQYYGILYMQLIYPQFENSKFKENFPTCDDIHVQSTRKYNLSRMIWMHHVSLSTVSHADIS